MASVLRVTITVCLDMDLTAYSMGGREGLDVVDHTQWGTCCAGAQVQIHEMWSDRACFRSQSASSNVRESRVI
jgi:hypothetical protein